jgi:hypothetical protein
MNKSDKVFFFLLLMLAIVATHIVDKYGILATGGLILLIACNIFFNRK